MSERIGAVLLVVGASFMLLAGLGVLRLPDLFMRLQAATKASTLGVGCLMLVSWVRSSLANPLESFENRVGVGGPDERLGVLVVLGEVVRDGPLQLHHAGEHPAPNPL